MLILIFPSSEPSVTFRFKLPGLGRNFLQFSLYHRSIIQLQAPVHPHGAEMHVHGEHRVGVDWAEGAGDGEMGIVKASEIGWTDAAHPSWLGWRLQSTRNCA